MNIKFCYVFNLNFICRDQWGAGRGCVEILIVGVFEFYIFFCFIRCLFYVFFLVFESNFLEFMFLLWVSNSILESLFLWRKIQLIILSQFCQFYKLQNLYQRRVFYNGELKGCGWRSVFRNNFCLFYLGILGEKLWVKYYLIFKWFGIVFF